MKLGSFFLAFKMLRSRRAFVGGFVLIFSLGLSLFLLTDNLSFFFKQDLQEQSREMLEGDLKIQSRRDFTEREEKWINSTLPKGTKKAEAWSFFSMVQSSKHTKLVQIKAMSSSYPLIGAFKFKENSNVSLKPTTQEVWVPPEFEIQFESKTGDSVQIGEKKFLVKKQYVETPQKSLEFFNLGIKLYIALDALPETNLLQKGSRIFKDRLYVLPAGSSLEDIKKALEKGLQDPEIKITTYSGQTGQINLITTRIFSFLSLATLSAFFLSALGAGHFFYRNLISQKKQFAQLSMVGYSPWALIKIGVYQNLLLALISSVLAIALCYGLGSIASPLIYKWFEVNIPFTLSPRLLIQAFSISCLTSFIFSLGTFKSIWATHPGILIQPEPFGGFDFKNKFVPFTVQAIYFYGLGFYTTSSFVQSGLFLAIVVVGFMLLGLLAIALFWILNISRRFLGYGGKVVLGNYKLSWDKTLMTFCMLGLAVTLTAIVPSLQKIILSELETPQDLELPQYFMFDIQTEQYPFLQDSLNSWGTTLSGASAMVRARLVMKNGKPIRKDLSEASTPEENTRQRFNNRGYNLSYREKLSSSETITSGKWWQGSYDENSGALPQISVEKKFAARLNIHLDDTLDFDVQGVPIQGKVTSLRRVRWASFQPNFFVLFQPGVLEMAPGTYIGTLPQLGPEKGYQIEKQIVKSFPNITIINLKDVIEKLLNLYQKMGWLVVGMAVLGLCIGLIILALLLHSIIQDAKRNTLLMMVLGVSESKIVRWAFFEFSGLIFGAALLGFCIAQLAVALLNSRFMELPFIFHTEGFLLMVAGSVLCVLLCLAYVRSIVVKGQLSQFFQPK